MLMSECSYPSAFLCFMPEEMTAVCPQEKKTAVYLHGDELARGIRFHYHTHGLLRGDSTQTQTERRASATLDAPGRGR